ncbi:MAG: hypothetical protein M3228_09380 [Actinomycetota bacterium]|nr:hypothetical protein [Actinomycetota bacterium]
MSENQPDQRQQELDKDSEPGEHQSSAPSGKAPSAEEFKERVDNIGEESNLGAGESEADPVTAETPPQEIRAGDEKRVQT